MNSFKKIFLITILIMFSGNVLADNHEVSSELVEKAKESGARALARQHRGGIRMPMRRMNPRFAMDTGYQYSRT